MDSEAATMHAAAIPEHERKDPAPRPAPLEAERATSPAYAEQLEQRCELLEREIRQLRGSRSWRWTAPLRRVFDLVSGGAAPLEAPPPRDPLVPPDALRIEGGHSYEDYITVGDHFFGHFVKLGGLRPTDRVLEVGAATGRMARPLTRYLRDEGEYHGIEIVASAVEWAQQEFSSRHPRFHFIHADVHNEAYNPAGAVQASEYRFPFPDAHFDFGYATSVFTHMLPRDIQHYLREVARVLRPGGSFLATFFLLTPEADAAMAAGVSGHSFLHQGEGYRALTSALPEGAIAFEEEDVRRMYREAGLALVDPVYPGGWTGRRKFKTYQDVVLARKPA